MDPTERSPAEDFRLSIDWGTTDDLAAPAPHPDDRRLDLDLDEPSAWDERETLAAPTAFAFDGEAALLGDGASLDSIQAAVLSATTRLEELYGEANKLRLVTGDRLAELAAQAGNVTTTASAVRGVVQDVTDAVQRVSSELSGVMGLLQNIDLALTEVTGGQLQRRIDELVEEAANRIRSAVQEAEVTLRDVVAPGRAAAAAAQEEMAAQVAEMANELRLVKRRLALRAKAPPAQLDDEQIEHVVRSVTAAVTEAIAVRDAEAARAGGRRRRG